MLTAGLKRINTITDAQMLELADRFNVTPRAGILK